MSVLKKKKLFRSPKKSNKRSHNVNNIIRGKSIGVFDIKIKINTLKNLDM